MVTVKWARSSLLAGRFEISHQVENDLLSHQRPEIKGLLRIRKPDRIMMCHSEISFDYHNIFRYTKDTDRY